MKKKLLTLIATILVLTAFGVLAMGSTSDDSGTNDQGVGTVDGEKADNSTLGKYKIEIKSCRLARDYEGKAVVIVTYGYTNNSDDATPFMTAVSDNVFQNGIGLTEAIVLENSANYSVDNQMKSIQKGATLDVDVAYVLNDSTTDIVVEVTEWISLSDAKITKTFKIA